MKSTLKRVVDLPSADRNCFFSGVFEDYIKVNMDDKRTEIDTETLEPIYDMLLRRKVAIKEVIYNNPVVIVFWDDDTKTISKASDSDEFSAECGLAICIMKKIAGNTETKKIFSQWLPETLNESGQTRVALKDIRRKIRSEEKAK